MDTCKGACFPERVIQWWRRVGRAEWKRDPPTLLIQTSPCALPIPLLLQSELVHTDVIKLKVESSTTEDLEGLQLHTVGRSPKSLTSRLHNSTQVL